jgi:hypothetical protein
MDTDGETDSQERGWMIGRVAEAAWLGVASGEDGSRLSFPDLQICCGETPQPLLGANLNSFE